MSWLSCCAPAHRGSHSDRHRLGACDTRSCVEATNMRRSAITASDGIVAANRETGHVARLGRVRLPRAALPSLGIPILDPDAPGMLEAEVTSGAEGLPRVSRSARGQV